MFELLGDYTVRIVVLSSAAIGATSGALGCFAYLRRQSLVGDVISHSSLLGIVSFFWLWFIFTGDGNKSLWLLIPGAMTAAIAAMLLTQWITKTTKIKADASLGVMLAIFFGSGLTLLRWIQRSSNPIPGQAGLENFLFGMAAATTLPDLWMIGILSVVSLTCVVICWSRLTLLTFDPGYAAGLGLSLELWELLLLSLLVSGIVIGLQIAGVVLMVALLIAPASAARQWTNSLGRMIFLAALIGAVCAASGAFLSAAQKGMPTGPVIVLFLVLGVLVSILLAPKRGVLSRRRSIVT